MGHKIEGMKRQEGNETEEHFEVARLAQSMNRIMTQCHIHVCFNQCACDREGWMLPTGY